MNLPKPFNRSYTSLPVDDSTKLQILKPRHAESLFEVIDDNRDYIRTYEAWADMFVSVQFTKRFIQKAQELTRRCSHFEYGIFTNRKLVGQISLSAFGWLDHPPEIGYWVSEDMAGRGITTRATEVVTRFGLETLGMDELTIRTFEDNIGSNRVAEKVGYQLVSQLHDLRHQQAPINFWKIDADRFAANQKAADLTAARVLDGI